MIVIMGKATAGPAHPTFSVRSVHAVVAVVASEDVEHADAVLRTKLEAAGFIEFVGSKAAIVPRDVPGRSAEQEAMFRDAADSGICIAVYDHDERGN